MTHEEYASLRNLLWSRQHGKCATCGQPLSGGAMHAVEIAHRVPRGELKKRRLPEWHPEAVVLVCTRKGHDCNDAALLPIGLPRQELLERIVRLTQGERVTRTTARRLGRQFEKRVKKERA